MTALSERLRRANQGAWDAMQAHRFVCEIEADALSADVFGRYLANERGFVETAILIFGHALLKAPDFAARRRLCGVLHGLGGPQLGYFDRAGAAPAGPPPAAAVAFNAGMLQVAETGGYLDIMTIMLAAEWTYATWCDRAHQRPSRTPLLAEWVRLHAEPEFCQQAQWLQAQVDGAEGDFEFDRLARLFGQALDLEIAFHSAAYASQG